MAKKIMITCPRSVENAWAKMLEEATVSYIKELAIKRVNFETTSLEEALKLINYIMESEYDVVYSKYQKKNHNYFRNIGSWLNGKIANLLLEKPPNLYLSSFKAISRFTVNEITKYELSYPYIDGLIFRSTSNIGTLQTKHLPRSSGKSGYNMIKLMRIWLNMFTNFSVLPLRLASFTGFLLASTGISLGIFTIYERILDPYLPVGWASLLVVVSILGGFN